jgi:hypothetical protein
LPGLDEPLGTENPDGLPQRRERKSGKLVSEPLKQRGLSGKLLARLVDATFDLST